eukprot:1775295-Amphidinium_carterae.1
MPRGSAAEAEASLHKSRHLLGVRHNGQWLASVHRRLHSVVGPCWLDACPGRRVGGVAAAHWGAGALPSCTSCSTRLQ